MSGTKSLAALHDPRFRAYFACVALIQIGMGLFMLVSLAWGVLFLTGTLEMWHA